MRLAIIWVVGLFLSLLSLVILKSISPDLVSKQFWFFSLSWLVAWLLTQIPGKWLEQYAAWAYWALSAILLILLFTGNATRGTVGWFELGSGLKVQPSQFAVPIVGWYLAQYLKDLRKINTYQAWQVLWRVMLPGMLIALEPDFGTATVYFVSVAVFLLPFRIPMRYLMGGIFFLIIGIVVSWFFIFKPYQRDRLVSFVIPNRIVLVGEESSAQYNARQALIAVGSGGIFGQGLGQGVQSHLRFLPERQTDFIFASLAEEMGLIGSLAVVLSYGIIIGVFIRTLIFHGEQTELIFLLSLTVFIFTQAGINIGMNIGLLPITGITLPLLSYGGSSILAFCLGLGLAMRQISRIKPKVVLKIT